MARTRKPLYAAHPAALQVQHAELEAYALQQLDVFVGTAGSVVTRKNASGFELYAHKFLDGPRKQRERYLGGPVGSPKADAVADEMRARIAEVKDLVPTLRMLGREGFSLVDARTFATVAAMHNHGVFRAGGMLIGSHAYGILLNHLGIRAAPYATEDIDIARNEALAFADTQKVELLEVLRESGVDFVEVPALNRKEPSTSFKQKGKARFRVDLLVPSAKETFPTVAVPELKAHAKGLPFLKYLLVESQTSVLLAREGCCSVRIPLPERFAVHKLAVSQLRTGRGGKSSKDVMQASVLSAALADLHPGALGEAVSALPSKMRRHFRKALQLVQPKLEVAAPEALDELMAGS